MTSASIDSMAAALVGVADPEIVALESRLRTAQLEANTDALNDLIADDLLFAGPDGQLATKSQDLDSHSSGTIRIRAHEPEELRIRRIGADVAIVSLRARLTVEVAGAIVRGRYRYTRIWARENGDRWRVVGGNVSEVLNTADYDRSP